VALLPVRYIISAVSSLAGVLGQNSPSKIHTPLDFLFTSFEMRLLEFCC